MPICSSPFHAHSAFPRILPLSDFYRRRAGGNYARCRYCCALRDRLTRRYGHAAVSVALLRQEWRAYHRMRAQRLVIQPPPPGQRWCIQGHYASPAHFYPPYGTHRLHRCRDCQAIRQIQYYHRRVRGVAISWEVASRRHFLGQTHRTRQKNAVAPSGQRWCSHHHGYYVVPGSGTPRHRGSVCLPCRRVAARRYRAQAKDRQHATAA